MLKVKWIFVETTVIIKKILWKTEVVRANFLKKPFKYYPSIKAQQWKKSKWG